MAKLRILVKRRVELDNGAWALSVLPVALTTDAGAVIGAMDGDPFNITGLTSVQAAANPPGTVYNCPIQA